MGSVGCRGLRRRPCGFLLGNGRFECALVVDDVLQDGFHASRVTIILLAELNRIVDANRVPVLGVVDGHFERGFDQVQLVGVEVLGERFDGACAVIFDLGLVVTGDEWVVVTVRFLRDRYCVVEPDVADEAGSEGADFA